jgi:hypothetical protein
MSDSVYTHEVTIRSVETAPGDLNFWTFFWTMPAIDSDAEFDYLVREPDGKEYYRHAFDSKPQKGNCIRSDFKLGFAGGDPMTFAGQYVEITFRVSKGKIEFDSPETFRFTFSKQTDVKATIKE